MIGNEDLAGKRGVEAGLSVDVAIVGAGCSGVYSGYRLMTGTPGANWPFQSLPSVYVFETSERVGGRLESIRFPGTDLAAELGGMRFTNGQKIVWDLIDSVASLKAQRIDFPMGDPANHFMYLRKQRFRANAWQQAQSRGDKFITRYHLNQADVGQSSDQLFNKIVKTTLEKDGIPYPEQGFTRLQWNEIKPKLGYRLNGPYQGLAVNDLGFWNVIKDQISQEGYEFVAQAGGYYSNTLNWNAAEAFPYMVGDFASASVTYHTLKSGFQQFPLAIADKFLRADPGRARLYFSARLDDFERSGDPRYPYRLIFFDRAAGTRVPVLCKHLILAMPRRSLELVDQYNFFFDRNTQGDLQNNIASVIDEPAFKILMGFEYPWWRKDFDAMAGESITDLPMRQCYYFGVDPANSHSIFMASYNDMRTVPFWRVLEQGGPYAHRATDKASLEALNALEYPIASERMTAEALAQVRELHGPDVEVPAPYFACYRDWSQDPYGGGYHAWRAGYKVWDVMPYMRQPDPREAIHVCGEAYSDQQGWVEGALCVAERMLEEHFGLERPKWLDPEYYLGW